jgi:hypothetical protein
VRPVLPSAVTSSVDHPRPCLLVLKPHPSPLQEDHLSTLSRHISRFLCFTANPFPRSVRLVLGALHLLRARYLQMIQLHLATPPTCPPPPERGEHKGGKDKGAKLERWSTWYQVHTPPSGLGFHSFFEESGFYLEMFYFVLFCWILYWVTFEDESAPDLPPPPRLRCSPL